MYGATFFVILHAVSTHRCSPLDDIVITPSNAPLLASRTTMSFAEVSLLYPSHQSQERRRFVIHDEEGSIERVSASNKNATGTDASRLRLSGSSSASSLADDVVVTTCALVNEPTVLSVSLLQGKASPIMVDLDLGQTKVFGIPVKIQCFPAQAGSSLLLLRLVDTRGIVLSITLDSASLTPDALQLLSVPHLVESQLSYDSGAELDSSMVTFLSSAVLVIGLAPNLLAVNIDSGAIDIWSQAQTLEEMKSKSLGHIFSKASDLFLGRPEDEDDVDMPPAAAICQAGGQYVFTLHSDASIRRWRVDELHPTEVVPLKVAQDAIPAPEQWSDSPGTVALCAQLYSSVYALAIHVQTIGGDENKSPCHMIVVHGSQDEAEGGDLVKSAVPLIVPKAATSLVGLDLASERCRLTALFQSQENALFVTYPPSIVSIVSNEPIVTPHENTLDGVAASERVRMTRLSFPVNGASLEEDLHAVDTAFLKYLFRPAFSRGIGVVTPPSCVRAAIRKLVPGHFVSSGEDMSIELETLRAIHEWRRLDSRNMASPGARQRESIVANTPGGSVYDNYARQDPDGTPEMDMDDSYMEDEEDLMDQERAAQIESQQQRWRELLLAVWNEEERMRDPLCVSNILSKETSSFVLVRAGVTSLLKEVDTMEDATSIWQDLDRSALILLGSVEKDEQELAELISTETLLFEEIAKASLALSTGALGGNKAKLSSVGSRALAETDNDEINRDGVALALREASQEDMLDWLQSIESVFSLGLPGASVLPDSADVLDDESGETWTNRIADAQTRLAASGLFVQCTDSVRRLTLARLLLLSSFSNEASSSEDPIFQAAFRQYLYSVSVLWTCAQQVPMPSAGLFGRNRNVEFGVQTRGSSPSDSPPLKRVNFGETTSSILAGGGGNANSNATTALDARFIQISQAHSQSLYGSSSPDGPITTMVRICVNSTFAAALSSTLPELGVLPSPSDESVASDYPRLALRLIAPFYAEPPLNEDEEMLLARKEALAECLLIEANAESQKGPSSEPLVNSLQVKACDLLSPSSSDTSPSDAVEHNLLETVFMTLSKQSQVMVEPDLEEIERSERALADELKLLLTGTQGRPGTEITRLCQQPTVMAVFLPLMATERRSFFRSLEELSRASVKSMVEVLLRISKLMHRLSILERHTGSVGGLARGVSSGKNDFLLGYIEETISEFQTLLPRSVYNSMTEYASLWTLLFNHSVSARRWKTAHRVCVDHPVQERRVENYKRLVIAMVNAGSLSELIDLCTMVVAGGERTESLEDGGACIDFYEIAAETLAAARQGDPYEHGSISTDFLGCLYALHAARGHWGRAAQAMDEKYTAALKALSPSRNQGSRLASVVNVNAAANDLVLASLFSSNAVQSIEDPSKRFLVGGEVGPFPSLPDTSASETDVVEAFGVKRGRSEQGWTTPRRADHVEREGTDEYTRLSRFMTVVDLNARAARAVALWIFLHDKKVDHTSVSLAAIESPSAEGDRACIDRLASLGYYEQAILVAKAIDAQCEERTCGANPGGRSLLQDSILQVLTYVLPVAFRQTSRPSSDEMETDEERHRPTLSQLQRAIEEAGGMSKDSFSFVLGETWCPVQDLPAVATACAAMELIRKLTTECSSASSPIALEVACMFLDIDPSGASVPLWLERLLVGRNVSGEDSSGLFAPMATASGGFSGDPAGLVSLYMKRGLYVKACDIVSAILTGTLSNESDAKSRETQAPSRLPEKGDIDFVPYAKIDVLWTLIDRALASPVMDTTERKKLEESRMVMERALEKHFELMKISEQGMRSARALTQ